MPRAQIGASGREQSLVFSVVAPFFLVGLAAVNVGIAAAALKAASEHACEQALCRRERSRGGAGHPAPARGHGHCDALGTPAVQEAARLGDAGDEGALVPIMEAKVSATDAAAQVTQRALEVCGGQGYTPALPIERHLRDARAGAVMAPTNAVLRSWIGKALAGLPVP